MAFLRTTVTGSIYLPDGSVMPDGANIIFTLRSWDKDADLDAVAVHGQVVATVVNGAISTQLIRTASTDRQITYDVGYIYRNPWTQLPVAGRLGVIALSGAADVDIDDLLALPAPDVDVPDALAQALAAATDAMQAAQAANVAALMALVGTGTGFDSVQQMEASTLVYGANSITHNGETVTINVVAGDIWVTKDGFAYEVQAEATESADVDTSGGVKLFELGRNFSTLARFQRAVAAGFSVPIGCTVVAGGVRYAYAGGTAIHIAGLPGWRHAEQVAFDPPLWLRDKRALAAVDFRKGLAYFNGQEVDCEEFIADNDWFGVTTSVRPYVDRDGSLKMPAGGVLARDSDGNLLNRLNSTQLITDPEYTGLVPPCRTHWTDYNPDSNGDHALADHTFVGTQNGLAVYINGTGTEDGWPYIEFRMVPDPADAPVTADLQWDMDAAVGAVYQNEIYTLSAYVRVISGDDVIVRPGIIQGNGFIRSDDGTTLSPSSERARVIKAVPMRSGSIADARLRFGVTLTQETIWRVYTPQMENWPWATDPILTGVRQEALTIPAISGVEQVDIVMLLGNGAQVLQQEATLPYQISQFVWQDDRISEIYVLPHRAKTSFDRDDRARWLDAAEGGTAFNAAMLAPEVTPYNRFARLHHTQADLPRALKRNRYHVSRWRFEVDAVADYDSGSATEAAHPVKTELQSPGRHYPEWTGSPEWGEDVWCAFSIKFGERTNPFDAEYFITGQWHAVEDAPGTTGTAHTDVETSPNMAFHLGSPRWGNQSATGDKLAKLILDEDVQLTSDRLFVFTYSDPAEHQSVNNAEGSRYACYDLSGGPIERGVWHHIVYRVRFGFSDDAELELWFNGVKKINVTGVNIGHNDTHGPIWNYGIYSGWWNHDAGEPRHVVEYANMELSWPSRGGGSLAGRVGSPRPI